MTDLVIYERKGGLYADSREVAEYIDVRHDNLVRDIQRYCSYMEDPETVQECDDLQNSKLRNADNQGVQRFVLLTSLCPANSRPKPERVCTANTPCTGSPARAARW